ncbi:ClpP/crotonase-like domain-containing protein [Syncephalastrum racemosum]|uniref:ClpP/crotonase-like domain-containing protein n=1 Tax=Syncephalastrum racemosum TaxID=13706 RepID=A0A1X2H583_SYNRA|nr:ClpP/crotonase-like domain-containing protein [Syncephalastrum racemosum]
MSVPKLETIEITLFETGVAEIAFNRPQRYNALSPQAYADWLEAIRWAANDDRAKVTVLTGRGKYYTSGQELAFPEASDDPQAEMNRRAKITEYESPSIGFGTTTLALCDVIYSVPHATFATPFMKLGFCAEGCSSVLFPRIMGRSKANEMLLMGKTFTAEELEKCSFLSRLLPAEGFREQVLALAEESAKFSVEAMKVTKGLIRDVDRELLEKTNEIEMKCLIERMMSPDSLESIMKFLAHLCANS